MTSCGHLENGRMTLFGGTRCQTGFPPDWFADPVTGKRAPSHRHWSRIKDFGALDIKLVWEPNRFGFAYDLVRAYWRTGDDRYAELFWQAVEDWQDRNPPQSGPNWKCGQEVSFRVMAWAFGLFGFLGAQATTSSRFSRLVQMMAVSGHRIASNIGYALRQRNNHGISEAMGLWTIGLLFPQLKDADAWRERGRKHLEDQGRRLIYDDGSFSQHSLNYHRLMLHDYCWAIRLGDLNGHPLSQQLRERVGKAVGFLYQVQDAVTGRAPNYGQNDGALVLPLTNCDHRDMRPVVQAAWFLCHGTKCWPEGPWDEALLWLFGTEALKAPLAPPERSDLQATDGGYYTLRSANGFAFTRCGTFRHRPSQADMLHMDVWWRGENIAIDPGTYSYHAPAPWNNPLARTRHHNTVTVDGCDQMERVGPFLWAPRVRGEVREMARSELGLIAYLEAEHDGFTRLPSPVRYRRAVMAVADEYWVVLDHIMGDRPHLYRLHWLLNDYPYVWNAKTGKIRLTTPAGLYCLEAGTVTGPGRPSVVRGAGQTPRGWKAPFYASKEPAISLAVVQCAREALFVTALGPGEWTLRASEDEVCLKTPTWEAQAMCGLKPQYPLVRSVMLEGERLDGLIV